MKTEKQAEAQRLQQQGMTRDEVARAMGGSASGVKSLLERARKWDRADSALGSGANAIGADTPASVVWTKTHRDGTVTHSVMHSTKPALPDPDEYAEAIRAAIKTVPPPILSAPKQPPMDIMATFTVADLHMGLLTDQEEVGEDWDTKKAQKVFQETFGRLVSITPDAGTALLAQLGDLTHNDDQRNVTPQSGHQLDVDSRFFMILRRAVAVMKWAIETLRQKYNHVIYRGCRGNHDMTAHHAVTLALSEYYADTDDVTVVQDASDFYVHEFGANMIFLHHGDRAKPDRLVHFAAAEFPEIWGRTKHRIALSGHVHHEVVKEIGGMRFESVGTIIPRDAFAYTSAFSGGRSLVSIVHHREDGEISRARVGVAS